MRNCHLVLILTLLLAAPSIAQELPVPESATAQRRFATAFGPDMSVAQPVLDAEQPWQHLQRMGQDVRSRATLTVVTEPAASSEARALAVQAAAAWNAGDDIAAVRALYDLGQTVDPSNIELLLNWRDATPVSRTDMLAGNVRIGTLDSVASVAMAANADASRLYVMVSHSSSSGSMHLYRSTDKGDSWTLVQTISAIGAAPRLALAPLSGGLYVGYIPTSGGRVLRLRKFSMDTGTFSALTNGANFLNLVSMPAADTLREVAGSSNILTLDNRIYFAVSTHAKRARFFWADPASDSSWNEIVDSAAVGVTRGLSISYARGPLGHHAYVSYIDSLDRVCIDTANAVGTMFRRSTAYANAGTLSNISGHGDTALCAFDYYGATAYHSRYLITYNGGRSWLTGAPIDTTLTSETGTPMLEKGQGMLYFYRHYTATGREGRVIFRTYSNVNPWSAPVAITDYTPHYWPYGIAALGGDTWGVAYITFNFQPALRAVIFAKFQKVPTGVATDDEHMPSSYALFQNFPNPFNPSTEIAYELPEAAHVTLTVYDVLGKQVAVLVNGMQQPGPQSVRWNASGLSSGVYYYRLQAGDFSAVKKTVLMK